MDGEGKVELFYFQLFKLGSVGFIIGGMDRDWAKRRARQICALRSSTGSNVV